VMTVEVDLSALKVTVSKSTPFVGVCNRSHSRNGLHVAGRVALPWVAQLDET
jgi:hypothetical protein